MGRLGRLQPFPVGLAWELRPRNGPPLSVRFNASGSETSAGMTGFELHLLSFTSSLPSDHPRKAAIEARLRRFLQGLGSRWSMSIALDPDGSLAFVVRRRSWSGEETWCSRIAPAEQAQNALERWLRVLAQRLARECTRLRIGLVPTRDVGGHDLDALLGGVALCGGRRAADGLISLPGNDWAPFVERVEGGVPLEVVAREA
jgi:hypothetical protein